MKLKVKDNCKSETSVPVRRPLYELEKEEISTMKKKIKPKLNRKIEAQAKPLTRWREIKKSVITTTVFSMILAISFLIFVFIERLREAAAFVVSLSLIVAGFELLVIISKAITFKAREKLKGKWDREHFVVYRDKAWGVGSLIFALLVGVMLPTWFFFLIIPSCFNNINDLVFRLEVNGEHLLIKTLFKTKTLSINDIKSVKTKVKRGRPIYLAGQIISSANRSSRLFLYSNADKTGKLCRVESLTENFLLLVDRLSEFDALRCDLPPDSLELLRYMKELEIEDAAAEERKKAFEECWKSSGNESGA